MLIVKEMSVNIYLRRLSLWSSGVVELAGQRRETISVIFFLN